MTSSYHCGRVETRSLTQRLAAPNRLSVSRALGSSPARVPGTCPQVQRSNRTAKHRPCKAATMTAPPQTTQSGAGDGRQHSMEDAARHSEPVAERTLTRAVVIGGSIAGMFASAACAPHFDEVVVLERDAQITEQPVEEVYTDGNEYARDGVARRGVPQYVQIHGMLAKGWDLAERYMPGMQAAMEAAGAIRFNIINQGKETVAGITAYTPDAKGVLTNYLASRALIERVMRKKLLETHVNVTVRWASPAAGLQHGVGDDKGCITGVKMQDGTVLAADLVVDASGPRGKTKEWLREGGYPVQDIRTVQVDPHVGYTMEVLDVPEEVANEIKWKFNYVRPQAPESKGFLAIQVERGRFQVGTIGYGKGNHPPMDHEGYVAFIDSCGQPDVSKIVHSGTPVLRRSYKATKDVRHYYEDISLPGNFAVIGDAVAKFNPAYGQGITVAGVQVEALEAVLKERSSEAGEKLAYAQLRDLSSFLQKRISEKVEFAWTVACSEDLKHATTEGERSNSWAADLFAAYFQQLWFAATVDEKVKMVYQRVGNMLDDVSALVAPDILLRVLLYRIRRSLGIIKAPVSGNGRAASA